MKDMVQRRWLLSSDPAMVSRARSWVAEASAAVDPEIVETAKLLTSEVVTNALRYGDTPSIVLWFSLSEDTLRVEVDDNVRPAPRVRPPSDVAERGRGRGLMLVDTLAAEWGSVTQAPEGKYVWFRLDAVT